MARDLGDGDDPAVDDDIPFAEVQFTTVEAGETLTVGFLVVPQVDEGPVG